MYRVATALQKWSMHGYDNRYRGSNENIRFRLPQPFSQRVLCILKYFYDRISVFLVRISIRPFLDLRIQNCKPIFENRSTLFREGQFEVLKPHVPFKGYIPQTFLYLIQYIRRMMKKIQSVGVSFYTLTSDSMPHTANIVVRWAHGFLKLNS